jgi:CheY-like chemotaxis protein
LEPRHPARPDVQEVLRAAESAASLTRQLLAFSRRQILQTQILDLNAVVARAKSLLRRLIGEDIELTCRPTALLGCVHADPGQIEQIIMNLAVNARDAMRGGGKLTIETGNIELSEAYVHDHHGASMGPHVVLAVSDTGVGMDEGTRARIFEPFFTTKPRGEGTGLGLAMVYGIVKQSGGSIWVYSEPGRGTTFKIYFPRVSGDAPDAVVAPVPTVLEGTETILVAEDQAGIRTLIRSSLARYGYRILLASDGEQALQMAREHGHPIHLLLTDVVMPVIGGRELSQQLRLTHPETRVLYMSGYTDDAVSRHGVLEPHVAFLEKPFVPQALARKIRQVLDAPAE